MWRCLWCIIPFCLVISFSILCYMVLMLAKQPNFSITFSTPFLLGKVRLNLCDASIPSIPLNTDNPSFSSDEGFCK
uniref:Uncharacterized protein n=1 Tax=Rhizophora mucronata TaxID=61149 RepID=A0A2P2NE53_RHIMU